MTCRHRPGDPDCSSSPQGQARFRAEMVASAATRRLGDAEAKVAAAEAELAELLARTPNPEQAEIVEIESVGPLLVLTLQYSACSACSFDARKIVVVRAAVRDAVFWRRWDPHFDDAPRSSREMPPPLARFPASDEGRRDAMAYAEMKARS